MVKFAHLADVHIGAWRTPALSDLPNQAFAEAIAVSLQEKVNFIILAGDIFNSALPGIDHLKSSVRTLQRAKEAGIPVYCIPGSHDFSPTGKSMIHVLEEAGLLVDVFKGEVVNEKLRLNPVIDPVTGILLTGILGKRGMLDRQQYLDLDLDWLSEQTKNVDKKVFLFHTSINQLKPNHLEKMEGMDMNLMPSGFDYYAGGHVHIRKQVDWKFSSDQTSLGPSQAIVAYPGPVFPASFSELEKLEHGSLLIVEDFVPRSVSLELKRVVSIHVRVDAKSPEETTRLLLDELSKKDLDDAIVLLRVSGSIIKGETSSVDFRQVFAFAFEKNAFSVLRNSVSLQSESLESDIEQGLSTSQIEEKIFSELSGKISCPVSLDEELTLAKDLLRSLSADRTEGETKSSYEERTVDEAKHILNL